MAEDLKRAEAAAGTPLPAPGPSDAPPVAPPAHPTAALAPGHEPDELVAPPAADARPTPHARRFLLAYGLLGAILGAAVIAFVVATSGGDSASERAWSAWRPSGEGSERVREIAAHVARGYRLRSGRQLVSVLTSSPDVMNPPLVAAAIDEQTLFREEQRYTSYDLRNGLVYALCGFGDDCSIAEGKPSLERHQLLRREALELALYTFRYVDGIDTVIAVLPPRAPERALNSARGQALERQQQAPVQSALFFREDDRRLEPLLERPLRETLPSPRPPVPGRLPPAEGAVVDAVTLPQLYRFDVQPTPDGQGAVVLLSPLFDRG